MIQGIATKCREVCGNLETQVKSPTMAKTIAVAAVALATLALLHMAAWAIGAISVLITIGAVVVIASAWMDEDRDLTPEVFQRVDALIGGGCKFFPENWYGSTKA